MDNKLYIREPLCNTMPSDKPSPKLLALFLELELKS